MIDWKNVLRIFGCGALSLLAALVLFLLVFVFSVQSVFLNPAHWETAVFEMDLYSGVKAVIVNQLDSMLPPGIGFADASFRTSFVNAVFEKHWFEAQVRNLLVSFFGFLNGQTSGLSLEVSLVEPKAKAEVFLNAYAAQEGLGSVFDASDFSEFPDSLNLLSAAPEAAAGFAQVKQFVSLIPVTLVVLTVVLLLILFGLMHLAGVPGVWVCAAVIALVSGIFFLGFSFLVQGLVQPLMLQSLIPPSQGWESISMDSSRLVEVFLNEWILLWRVAGVVLFLAGIGSLAVYWKKRSKMLAVTGSLKQPSVPAASDLSVGVD